MTPLGLCVFLCFLLTESAQVAKTACRVPSVREMESTNLTCRFPEDLSVTRKDFTVYRLKGKEKPDAVVDCLWVQRNLNCYIRDGYKYNSVLSDTATIQIPRVSKNETGTYSCQMMGSQSEDLQYCELFLISDTCELRPENNTLTCYFPEDVAQSKKNFAVYRFDDRGRQAVIDCLWYMDRLSCEKSPGYRMNQRISNRLVVHIPQTSEDLTESYLCEMSGPMSNYVSLCKSTSLPKENIVYVHGDSESAPQPIAAIVVLVVLLLIALAAIFVICKYPHFFKKTDHGANSEIRQLPRRLISMFINIPRIWRRDQDVEFEESEPLDTQEVRGISGEEWQKKGKCRSFGVQCVHATAVAEVQTEREVIASPPSPPSDEEKVIMRREAHEATTGREERKTKKSWGLLSGFFSTSGKTQGAVDNRQEQAAASSGLQAAAPKYIAYTEIPAMNIPIQETGRKDSDRKTSAEYSRRNIQPVDKPSPGQKQLPREFESVSYQEEPKRIQMRTSDRSSELNEESRTNVRPEIASATVEKQSLEKKDEKEERKSWFGGRSSSKKVKKTRPTSAPIRNEVVRDWSEPEHQAMPANDNTGAKKKKKKEKKSKS